jgi:hypothetical protein
MRCSNLAQPSQYTDVGWAIQINSNKEGRGRNLSSGENEIIRVSTVEEQVHTEPSHFTDVTRRVTSVEKSKFVLIGPSAKV